jgi:exopolyphosphatase/guanosine-5'-triphosphate,3'-diphosphate pyrophosphatase
VTTGPRAPVAAVIDIGSNSVLLLVVSLASGARPRVVDQALATTRLGRALRPGGPLDPGTRAQTLAAVVAFAARARAAGAAPVWAFATGAVRDAADGRRFADDVACAAGVPVEILSGDREAHLAYDAVRLGLGLGGSLLVVDVGGRTTELALGTGDAVTLTASLPLGALALTEAHGSDPARLGAATDAVLGQSHVPARARASGARLVASGGTATALAALDLGLAEYAPARVHGHSMSRAALAALAALPASVRNALPALDPGRGAILPAGAVVLERLVDASGAAGIVVSDHGVRHGYLRAALARIGVRLDPGELFP